MQAKAVSSTRILEHLLSGIPYCLEISRSTMTKAVGPEEMARTALRVTRSHLKEDSDGRFVTASD